jgi:hypothetical protein
VNCPLLKWIAVSQICRALPALVKVGQGNVVGGAFVNGWCLAMIFLEIEKQSGDGTLFTSTNWIMPIIGSSTGAMYPPGNGYGTRNCITNAIAMEYLMPH